MVLAEQNRPLADSNNLMIMISHFVKAHLACMMIGRRFDNREHEILQMLADQLDEVVFGAYESYSLNRNDEELTETLRTLIQLEIEGEELDCLSPDYRSSAKSIQDKKDYQRDSWPMGFEKMVDRTKASKTLEKFKSMMSPVKYSILHGVKPDFI